MTHRQLARRWYRLLGAIELFTFAILVLTIALLHPYPPKSLYAVVVVFVVFGLILLVCRWAEKWGINEEQP